MSIQFGPRSRFYARYDNRALARHHDHPLACNATRRRNYMVFRIRNDSAGNLSRLARPPPAGSSAERSLRSKGLSKENPPAVAIFFPQPNTVGGSADRRSQSNCLQRIAFRARLHYAESRSWERTGLVHASYQLSLFSPLVCAPHCILDLLHVVEAAAPLSIGAVVSFSSGSNIKGSTEPFPPSL